MVGMVAVLVVIWIGFHIISGGTFLTPRNLWNLSVQTSSATGTRERRPMNSYGVTHLCVRVEDLDAVFAAAEQHGGTAHRGTLTVLPGVGVDGGDLQTVYLTDPDGVRIECIAGMPDLATVATAMGVA